MSGMLKSIKAGSDWFNNGIALMVAMVSASLAVANITNGNVSQAAQIEQRAAASTWNQYQAKRLRQFALDLRLQDFAARTADGAQPLSPWQQKLATRWRAKDAEYRRELIDLVHTARAHEKAQKVLSLKDNDFDVAEALLTLTLALLAVAALTRNHAILAAGLLTGSISIYFTIIALTGWQAFHPAWLLEMVGA